MLASESTFEYAYADEVIASGIVLPAVGIICVALRFVARDGRKNKIGMDDWLCLLAAFFMTGMGICLAIGAFKKVIGYPQPPPTSEDPIVQETGFLPGQRLLEQLEFAFFICMILSYGFIKLSVLFFYRRLFALSSSKFENVTRVAIVISISWTLAFLLVQIFSCGVHFEYHWGPLSQQHLCHGGLPFLEGLMISDFITDFLVLFLPFPMIWRLRTSFMRKLAITGIFLLGATSLAASAARMVLQIQLATGGYRTKTDVFLTITSILYWSMIEAGIAVIAICVPTLRTLIAARSVQSLVTSVRSKLSLDSLHSRSSQQLQ